MLELNKDNFSAEVLESKTPVLVDFWSHGCGPCKVLTPILSGMAEKMSSDQGIKFAKFEAGDGLDIFSEYKISHVPTMIIFKNGQPIDRKSGIMSEKEIAAWISTVPSINKE